MKEIVEFLDAPTTRIRAKWVKSAGGKLKVYVRRSKRYCQRTARYASEDFLECLDVASVEVDPLHQKQGIFTRFLEDFERLAQERGFGGVFVESVQNKHLRPFLERRGYERAGGDDEFAPSYLKRVG